MARGPMLAASAMLLALCCGALCCGALCCGALCCGAWPAAAQGTASPAVAEEASPVVEIPWRLVSMSDLVVRARLIVPDEGMRALDARAKSYVPIGVAISEAFKSDRASPLVQLRVYAEFDGHGPTPAMISAARTKDVILFLTHPYAPSSDAYYFAGHTRGAMLWPTPETERAVRTEIQAQAALARRVTDRLVHDTPPLDREVAVLIERLLARDTADAATRELLALDRRAVPALIRRMDDRRPLALPGITLRNASPSAFEGQSHYGPAAVVDLVSIVLDRLAPEGFTDIYNGGSELQRRRMVETWKVWLGKSLGW